MGLSLFQAAGVASSVPTLLGWLQAELQAWETTYRSWAEPHVEPWIRPWAARTQRTGGMLSAMQEQAARLESDLPT